MASCWRKERRRRSAGTRPSSGSILASGSTERMLQISNLNAWYGASHVLQDISIEVARGEIVCLIGRNGAGKTTTLKSVMGLMDRARGSVVFKGQELLQRPAHT